jgi:(1->4)-alpha-D-glucan 1-alpha-D-glucosylmutase
VQDFGLDIPLSTYRLQFNRHFTFLDACKVLPYLKKMGISHCYSSPILWSKSGSLHGYDIIDHSKIDPELGGEEYFNFFSDELKKHDMGLILDIVPNHMSISHENKWWMDILENGQASEYANFFDIDWTPITKELYGKVLVPVLGDHYGNILANGEFILKFYKKEGVFRLLYHDHEFPINPSSYPIILEHRLNELEAALGGDNADYHEFQSIIYSLKKLSFTSKISQEKIKERNREKNISFLRLSEICNKNKTILKFVEDNLIEFQCVSESPQSCERMHELLEQQAYRLAYWRVSADIINYRRFFDVNSLIALRMENNNVFELTHSLIFDLIKQKKVHGLRIDHPDGLASPQVYFENLNSEIQKRLSPNNKLFYTVAEKILADFEKLPQNWQIHGTTGYEFLNSVNNLFLNSKNTSRFSRIYNRFINKTVNFNELIIKCKKTIMKTALTSELSALANNLSYIFEKYYETRDYTSNSLRDALMEIISCFPIYRTYISAENKCKKSYKYIKWAVGAAKKRSKSTDPSIFDYIEKTLLGEFKSDKNSATYKEILDFSIKFQQYTAPLMAKGVEDTGFFNYNRLISLNEVGGNPLKFGISVEEFHKENILRFHNTPHSLIATSTHDTKLSEDVRARISLLSEIPEIWQRKINYWSKLNKSKKIRVNNQLMPDKNDEYLFYQAIIGVWEDKSNNVAERLENYMIKAAREAKVHTSWINMNSEYENSLRNFIKKIMNSYPNHPFWKDFLPFQNEISQKGYINSISKVALKLTSPGVPDIYQGNELWKYNLVDPDNRMSVDYYEIEKYFAEIEPYLGRLSDISPLIPLESGKLKLFITTCLLNFRKNHPDLLRNGDYIPIKAIGAKSKNIVAFSRTYGEENLITIAPRLIYSMTTSESPLPLGENLWKNTEIVLPEGVVELVDIFTGNKFVAENGKIKTGNVLNILPVSVLYSLSNLDCV